MVGEQNTLIGNTYFPLLYCNAHKNGEMAIVRFFKRKLSGDARENPSQKFESNWLKESFLT